jgi:hypothetical protein
MTFQSSTARLLPNVSASLLSIPSSPYSVGFTNFSPGKQGLWVLQGGVEVKVSNQLQEEAYESNGSP